MADEMEVDRNEITKKNEQIGIIFQLYDLIVSKLPTNAKGFEKIDQNDVIDLDISDQISGVLFTVYTLLRRTQNSADFGNDKYRAYTAKIGETDINIAAIATEFKALNLQLDWMMATPIVNLLTAFKGFFDEVRTGVTKFQVRGDIATKIKRARTNTSGRIELTPNDRNVGLAYYGLTNQHIPLLQGITLPPERKTGLLKSLGPMTQCVMLINEKSYPQKLVEAVKNSLRMLPMHGEIATALKDSDSPGRVMGLMKELADLLVLTTARSTQKIYFPISVARYLWSAKPADFQWNFANSNMLQYYTDAVMANKVKFTMRSGGSESDTAEVVFHSMFGTYMDDLGVLSAITNWGAWKQRKQLSAVFTKRSASPKVTFTPKFFTMVSKMAQALLTKNMGNMDPCATTRPSFNGIRKRKFSEVFLSYLQTGKTVSNYSTDPLQLQLSLRRLRDEITADMKSCEEAGTRTWYRRRDNSWVEEETRVEESGVSFWG